MYFPNICTKAKEKMQSKTQIDPESSRSPECWTISDQMQDRVRMFGERRWRRVRRCWQLPVTEEYMRMPSAIRLEDGMEEILRDRPSDSSQTIPDMAQCNSSRRQIRKFVHNLSVSTAKGERFPPASFNCCLYFFRASKTLGSNYRQCFLINLRAISVRCGYRAMRRRSLQPQIALPMVICLEGGQGWWLDVLNGDGSTSACDAIIIHMEKLPHSSIRALGLKKSLPLLPSTRTPVRPYHNKENRTRESFNQSNNGPRISETVPLQLTLFRSKAKHRDSKAVGSNKGREDGGQWKGPCQSTESERCFEWQEQNLPSYTFQKISPNTLTHSQTPLPPKLPSTFHMYSPNKLNSSKNTLPTLTKPKNTPEQDRRSEMRPSDFGAYSEKRNIDTFLRRFKQALQRNFIEGPNVDNEDELYKVEFCLLKEIHNEGKWLD